MLLIGQQQEYPVCRKPVPEIPLVTFEDPT